MAPAKKKPRLIAGTSAHGESKEKSSSEHTTQTIKESLAGLSNIVSVDKDLMDRRRTYVIQIDDPLNVTSDLQEDQLHIAENRNTDFTEEFTGIEKVTDGKPGKNAQKPINLLPETNDQDAIPKKRGRKKKATQPSLAKTSQKTTAEEEILNANNVSDDSKPKKRGRKKKSVEVGHPLDAVSGSEQSEGVAGSTSDLISTKQSGKQEEKEYEKAAENANVTTDLHKKPAKRGRKKKNP